MPGYEGLIEQGSIRTYFSKAMAKGRLSHAYLLSGAAGTGKRTLMRYILFRLFCEQQKEEPCLRCLACKKLLADSHMDVKFVRSANAKTGSIGVDFIREAVCEDAAFRPFYGGYKVYVIESADKMTSAAQNALLKTMEDPPSYVLLFLLCSNEAALLETIKSRLTKLRLAPVSREGMRRILHRHGMAEPVQTEEILAYAGGNPGLALEFFENTKSKERYRENLQILQALGTGDLKDFTAFGSRLLKREKELPEFIVFCRRWYRDMLALQLSEDSGPLFFPSLRREMISLGRSYGIKGIWQALAAVDRADENIRLQANRELLVNQLLLDLYR